MFISEGARRPEANGDNIDPDAEATPQSDLVIHLAEDTSQTLRPVHELPANIVESLRVAAGRRRDLAKSTLFLQVVPTTSPSLSTNFVIPPSTCRPPRLTLTDIPDPIPSSSRHRIVHPRRQVSIQRAGNHFSGWAISPARSSSTARRSRSIPTRCHPRLRLPPSLLCLLILPCSRTTGHHTTLRFRRTPTAGRR